MKTMRRVGRIVRAVLCGGTVLAGSSAFGYQLHRLGLEISTPPAALIVEDAQHRRSGIDMSKGVPKNGFIENYLEEIPNSGVEAQNIANDEPVGPRMEPTTGWFVDIMDGGDQVYTANLIGLQTGVASLGLDAGKPHQGMIRTFYTDVLIRKGLTRQVRVVFSPTRGFTLTAERIVMPDQLGESLQIACDLKLITPSGTCRSLQAKARAAADAIKRGNKEAARGSLNALLAEIQAQSGKHLKDPAASILREEAAALLKTIQ